MKHCGVIIGVVAFLALTGCSGRKTAPAEAAGTGEDKLSIALILATGGLGDRSLNDSAYDGIMQCKEKYGAVVQYVEPTEVAQFESHQREFAKSGKYDLIVTIGFDQADSLVLVAKEFPDQRFIAIDAQIEGHDNILSMTYKDNEKMFLQGIAGAVMTKTKKIGIVGGMDIPLINAFVAGFMAGAAYVDPSVEVIYKYVGSWSDANTGKELALSMYSEGCDVIVGAAGGSALGVYAAAKEVDKYSFAVDTHQIPNDPKHIVSNAIRQVGNAAVATVGTFVDNTFKGGWVEYGLKEGVVGYTFDGVEVEIPGGLTGQMEDAKAKIIAGEIKVPLTIAEAQAYRAALK
jgi:basic membrane protein A